jgi:hypothetical protein
MGINSILQTPSSGPGSPPGAVAPPVPADIENLPLPTAYATLSQLAPLVLEQQAKGTIAGAWLNKQNPDTQIKLGGYTLNVALTRRGQAVMADAPLGRGGYPLNVALGEVPDLTGYGIFMATGPDEFFMAGNNVQVTFSPDMPGSGFVGLAEQEAGRFADGKWVVTRYLAGDDSVLRYDFANIAALNQSGSGVRLSIGERAIQRVKVYRYK